MMTSVSFRAPESAVLIDGKGFSVGGTPIHPEDTIATKMRIVKRIFMTQNTLYQWLAIVRVTK
jgi:hypothetical protein